MISFSQKYLRQALGGLRVLKVNKQKIAPRHCVLIRGAADTVTCEAATHEESLRFEGRGECDAPASQLVPYELLADVLKSADADSTITLKPDALHYVTGGAPLAVPLPQHPVEDFPETPDVCGEPITLPAGVLGSMVEAQGCASSDPTRYILNSVLLSPHEVVATDGRQLYRRNGLELALPKAGAIFPASGALGVFNGDQPAQLWAWDLDAKPTACLAQGPWRFSVELIGGNYPNFHQVIPRGEDYRAVVRIAETDAVRLISVLPRLPGFKEDNSPVRLSINADRVELSPPARLPQVVVALEKSAVQATRRYRVQFNAGFLLAALKRGFRELHVKDEVSPLLMKDESRLNLWMPLRLDAPASPPAPHAPAPPEASPEPVQSNPPTEPQPETTMVAPKSQPAAEPAPAATTPPAAPAEAANESSPLDSLLRAKELLRELHTVLTDASVAVRELAREKRGVERDLDALKRNLRVLKTVEV
ncbi:MAG: DNA polymerase III subunit beta [Verrucomicrobia bacterium]|nr:DNA polymerase III subunit beta [Verrucomicrobiota bacterium]